MHRYVLTRWRVSAESVDDSFDEFVDVVVGHTRREVGLDAVVFISLTRPALVLQTTPASQRLTPPLHSHAPVPILIFGPLPANIRYGPYLVHF